MYRKLYRTVGLVFIGSAVFEIFLILDDPSLVINTPFFRLDLLRLAGTAASAWLGLLLILDSFGE